MGLPYHADEPRGGVATGRPDSAVQRARRPTGRPQRRAVPARRGARGEPPPAGPRAPGMRRGSPPLWADRSEAEPEAARSVARRATEAPSHRVASGHRIPAGVQMVPSRARRAPEGASLGAKTVCAKWSSFLRPMTERNLASVLPFSVWCELTGPLESAKSHFFNRPLTSQKVAQWINC